MTDNDSKMIVLTDEILKQGLSKNGGYSRKQLDLLGIEGFPKGWKQSLLGQTFSVELIEQFIALKNQHLS
jgi:hypothetical protein